jgi:hypothetical protein
MLRRSLSLTLVLALCLTGPVAYAQRGKGEKPGGEKGKSEPQGKKPGGEEKPGGEKPKSEPEGKKPGNEEKTGGQSRGGSKPPGGAWSENKKPAGNPSREHEPENKAKSPTSNEGTEAAAERAAKNKPPQATGAQGAAAGAAAANRDRPATSGATGAAAGAAAANRNNPAATGAQGAAAGAAAANRNNPAVTGAQGAAAGAAVADRNQPQATAAGYAAVRDSFNHPDVYSQQWYGQHDGAWSATNWAAGSIWAPTTMAGASSYLGYSNITPVSYGYGSNVVYQQGNVLVDGQSVGTAEHFSQQAADLALVGQNASTTDTEDWLPLGVFALVRDEDQHAQLTLQLAVNKQGILRGNYNDVVIDHVLPVHGAVDKETQRVAWTVDNNKNFFMEAGLSNLTTGEAPTLIHKSGRTERWLLVRLPQPEAQQ